jgi:KDO2-lipid IV(A) lauroyltransferase
LQISKLDGLGARDMLRTLKSGGTIAMLTDQKHREGMAIPFFGRDAMTVTGPAVLSLRTGAALTPVTMVRTKGARFAMAFHAPLQVARVGEKEADIRAILVAISKALEEAIRAHPEQWLWAHNRWMDKA